MFGKKKTSVVAPAEGGAEARAKARRKKATRLPKGVKQLIGYDAMTAQRGSASLDDGRWSATILFQDINYQLSPESTRWRSSTGGPSSSTASRPGKACRSPPTRRSRGVREILADVMMDETGDGLDHYRLD